MIKPPFLRSPYNYDVTEASDASAYVETMPSLTVQSMAEDADLNVLMKRFGVTGKMPENVRIPTYGDFTHVSDYRSAIEASRAAEDSFMAFPADIRALFENNPQYFLDYVENPANIEQVRKWFPKENLSGGVDVSKSGSQDGSGDRATAGASGGAAGGSAVAKDDSTSAAGSGR